MLTGVEMPSRTWTLEIGRPRTRCVAVDVRQFDIQMIESLRGEDCRESRSVVWRIEDRVEDDEKKLGFSLVWLAT